jgi:hypothetical protein
LLIVRFSVMLALCGGAPLSTTVKVTLKLPLTPAAGAP